MCLGGANFALLSFQEIKLVYYVPLPPFFFFFSDVEIEKHPTFCSSADDKWSFLGTVAQLEIVNNSPTV